MNDLNEDGARDAATSPAPRAMKYRDGHHSPSQMITSMEPKRQTNHLSPMHTMLLCLKKTAMLGRFGNAK